MLLELATAAQILLWLIVIGVFLASGQASLFHPAAWYLAFHGVVFVFRPILVHFFGFDSIWNYMGFFPTDEIFVRTLVITSAGMVVFVGACLWFSRIQPAFPPQPPEDFSVEQKRALLLVTLVLLPLIAYSIYFTATGSAKGERIGGVFVNTNSVGYVNDAQFALLALLCLWLVATRFHWLNLVPAILYIGYRSWGGWARFTIVLFVASVAVMYCWHRRRRWLALWLMSGCVPVFLLFTLLGHNRDAFKELLVGAEVRTVQYDPGMPLHQKIKRQYDNLDAANFDYMAFIIAVVPKRTGTYTYGTQYLQLFTEPVPRLLWKGKPVGPPVSFFDLNAHGNFIGLTSSLCGDGWMSGGWIGLIITMGIVGALQGLAHRAFWKHVRNPVVALFYLTALPMVAQWYRDGGISIAKFMLWNWLPLGMWVAFTWLLGRRLVPAYTFLLPGKCQYRLVSANCERTLSQPDPPK